jgi:hypothetical protein
LLNDWLAIQMDKVDALVDEADVKVAAIPDHRTLMLLIAELTVRTFWLETEVERLKGGRR